MNERTLFWAALEKSNPVDRQQYLDAACGSDTELRQNVEALLKAHAETDAFMREPILAGQAKWAGAEGWEQPTWKADDREGIADVRSWLSPTDDPKAIGRLGHYEVQAIVGQGGMGVVLRAFDTKLHRVVALKCMNRAAAGSGEARKRFIREAKAAAAVSHDNVVAIHAVDDAGPVPYLVMPFVAGMSLEQKIMQEGSLELKEVLRISLQIARGLSAAHRQGLVHRDIKPANILLENGVQRVKITDFGLARTVDDATVTQPGVITGTPQFMSPEQAEGHAIDHRSDLFSLGSVMYAMCTGRAPFQASTTLATLRRVSEAHPRPIRELNPEMPEWLCRIIAKLHAKEPSQRFQSAEELAEMLETCLAGLQQHRPVEAYAPVIELPPASSTAAELGAAGWSKQKMGRAIGYIAAAVVILFLLKNKEWITYPIKWFFFSKVSYFFNEDGLEARIWKMDPNPLFRLPEPSQEPGSDRFPIHLPGEPPLYTLSLSKGSMGSTRWEPGAYVVYVAKGDLMLDHFHLDVLWNKSTELQFGRRNEPKADLQRLQGKWYAKSVQYRQGPALGEAALPLTQLEISDHRLHLLLPGMDTATDFSVYVGQHRRYLLLNSISSTSTFRLNRLVEYHFRGFELHLYVHEPQPQPMAEIYRKQGFPIPVPPNSGLHLVFTQKRPGS